MDKQNNKIIHVKYSPDKDDYYSLVKTYCKDGYKQIIITSKLMTSIMEDYFFKKLFRVSTIEFMEEDEYLKNEMNSILSNLNDDRAYFGIMLNKIKFLSEDTAIDIKKIELKGKNDEEQYTNISIQVNGILRINEKCFDKEIKNLTKIIEGYLL